MCDWLLDLPPEDQEDQGRGGGGEGKADSEERERDSQWGGARNSVESDSYSDEEEGGDLGIQLPTVVTETLSTLMKNLGLSAWIPGAAPAAVKGSGKTTRRGGGGGGGGKGSEAGSGSASGSATGRGSGKRATLLPRTSAPIDHCSGVVLHVS